MRELRGDDSYLRGVSCLRETNLARFVTVSVGLNRGGSATRVTLPGPERKQTAPAAAEPSGDEAGKP